MLSSVQDKKNAGTAGWQIALRNFTRFFCSSFSKVYSVWR